MQNVFLSALDMNRQEQARKTITPPQPDHVGDQTEVKIDPPEQDPEELEENQIKKSQRRRNEITYFMFLALLIAASLLAALLQWLFVSYSTSSYGYFPLTISFKAFKSPPIYDYAFWILTLAAQLLSCSGILLILRELFKQREIVPDAVMSWQKVQILEKECSSRQRLCRIQNFKILQALEELSRMESTADVEQKFIFENKIEQFSKVLQQSQKKQTSFLLVYRFDNRQFLESLREHLSELPLESVILQDLPLDDQINYEWLHKNFQGSSFVALVGLALSIISFIGIFFSIYNSTIQTGCMTANSPLCTCFSYGLFSVRMSQGCKDYFSSIMWEIFTPCLAGIGNGLAARFMGKVLMLIGCNLQCWNNKIRNVILFRVMSVFYCSWLVIWPCLIFFPLTSKLCLGTFFSSQLLPFSDMWANRFINFIIFQFGTIVVSVLAKELWMFLEKNYDEHSSEEQALLLTSLVASCSFMVLMPAASMLTCLQGTVLLIILFSKNRDKNYKISQDWYYFGLLLFSCTNFMTAFFNSKLIDFLTPQVQLVPWKISIDSSINSPFLQVGALLAFAASVATIVFRDSKSSQKRQEWRFEGGRSHYRPYKESLLAHQ